MMKKATRSLNFAKYEESWTVNLLNMNIDKNLCVPVFYMK